MPKRRLDPLVTFGVPLTGAGMTVPNRGTDYFVSTFDGSDEDTGLSWDRALATMAEALDRAETHDTIYFVGKIAEQITIADITDLNLKFDIKIVGCGSQHHADQPGSGSTLYDYGAAVWQPAGTPESTTPLIQVTGRGWKFINILFDAPTDDSAVELVRNALSGTSEYDAGHASFIGCDFRNGLRGIEDNGGCFNVTVRECVFETLDATSSGGAIINTSASVAFPRRWRILDNFFQTDSATEGNERHIVSPLNGSLIKGNVFGTVKGTGLYIDLTGGTGNVVTQNYLMGSYDTSDYVAGTGDGWSGNFTADISGNTAVGDNGITIAVPAAP